MKKMMTVVLALCTLAAPMFAQTASSNHHALSWIVAYSTIEQMQAQPGGPEVVKKLLADPHTIIVAANPVSGVDEAQRAVSVLSSDDCTAALDKSSNAKLTKLFVDLENWPGTPPSDQKTPQEVTRKCHEHAHDKNRDFVVIAVPAMDLMSRLDPDFKGTQYQAAIHYDLEGKLATVSDGMEVQLENIEDKPDEFVRTLQTMVHQIREARIKAHQNPDIPIYVGLSTAVVNKPIRADVLVNLLKEDVNRTRGMVTGYWMANPSKKLCPGCDSNPEVAVKLFQSVDE